MEELIERLRALFAQIFPGSTAELEEASPAHKVGGFLIWNGFDGIEQIDRQHRLKDAMRRNLTADEQLRVTTILTLTPDEVALMR